MGEYTFSNLRDFAAHFARDMQARERRIHTAVRKTTREARNYVARERVPKAFGELRESLHVEDTAAGSRVVADAPHAAAVEVGSRPHTPPLAPLIAWVKLRGMQGLQMSKLPKGTPQASNTREVARVIASALKDRERGGALGVDEPKRIARAIQRKISKYGTKPFRYMSSSVPPTVEFLDRFVKEALPDR